MQLKNRQINSHKVCMRISAWRNPTATPPPSNTQSRVLNYTLVVLQWRLNS